MARRRVPGGPPAPGPRVVLLAAALAVALVAAGCQPGPDRPGSTGAVPAGAIFTEAVTGLPGFLNPLFADEDGAREINSLVYQGLTRVDADQQAEPLLASSVRLSDDRLTYSVTLKDGLRWADGEPFTIADVLFTFGTLQDPGYAGPEAAAWKGVSIRQSAASALDFTLKAPSAGFPLSLRIGILPRHLFAEGVAGLAGNPHSGAQALGTGPFQVESVSADRTLVTLRRNPRATPAPRLAKVLFRSYPTLADAAAAVARGEADAVGGYQGPDLQAVLGRTDLVLHDLRTFSFASIFLNLTATSTPLGSTAVRRALSQSIDRARLVREILAGRADGQLGPIPPSSWAYAAPAGGGSGYDPAAAMRALDEAGWILPAQALQRTRGGRELEVKLVAADTFPFREVAAAIAIQLLVVGVRVTVLLVPISQLVSRHLAVRTYEMALTTYDNGPDPDQFPLWHSSQRAYPLNFSNLPRQSFIDKDLEDGRAGRDRAERQPAYGDFQALMAEAAPALFLYEPHYLYSVSKRVHGVRINPTIEALDRFEHIAEWSRD